LIILAFVWNYFYVHCKLFGNQMPIVFVIVDSIEAAHIKIANDERFIVQLFGQLDNGVRGSIACYSIVKIVRGDLIGERGLFGAEMLE